MIEVNPMREVVLDKVTVNVGVGEAGERLVKALKVLELITGQKPVKTISNTTNRDLGIRRGQDIGCKVTLRGKSADEFLKKAFWTRDNRIAGYSFDPNGNFSFGIPDHTDFEGMKYDPEIGIIGMDINVTLKRRGKRITQRKLLKRKVPSIHRVAKKEGIEFVRSKLNIEVVE